MEGDTEELKKQNSERMLNDELEFTKKREKLFQSYWSIYCNFVFHEVNELEDKFNEERDRLLGEIDRRKEQFNVMQAKAEFQVWFFKFTFVFGQWKLIQSLFFCFFFSTFKEKKIYARNTPTKWKQSTST